MDAYAAAVCRSPSARLIPVPWRSATVVAEDVDFPNGLAFINNGRTLVVAETSAQRLTAFPIAFRGDRRNRLFLTPADTGGRPLADALAAGAVDTTVASPS
jgi:sugar lactone lactonase YvrE